VLTRIDDWMLNRRHPHEATFHSSEIDAFTGLIDRDDNARSFAEIACLNAKTSALQRDQRSSSFKYAEGSTRCH
jgi:hypothetical protein